jgi:hypothetical protein
MKVPRSFKNMVVVFLVFLLVTFCAITIGCGGGNPSSSDNSTPVTPVTTPDAGDYSQCSKCFQSIPVKEIYNALYDSLPDFVTSDSMYQFTQVSSPGGSPVDYEQPPCKIGHAAIFRILFSPPDGSGGTPQSCSVRYCSYDPTKDLEYEVTDNDGHPTDYTYTHVFRYRNLQVTTSGIQSQEGGPGLGPDYWSGMVLEVLQKNAP